MSEVSAVLTSSELILIARVNQNVNHEIKYRTDKSQYGKNEHWTVPKEFGDCEDYAILKARRLVEHGIAPEYVRLATCMTPNGGHCVLVVKRREGDLVLDNNFDKPMLPRTLRSKYQYEWYSIQNRDRSWRIAGSADHL